MKYIFLLLSFFPILIFGQVEQTQHLKINSEVIFSGLNNPWAVVSGPDGKTYVTETEGRIRIFEAERLVGELQGLPKVEEDGQGGLLDIAFHPRFAETKWIYLSFTVNSGSGMHTRIARYRMRDNLLSEEKIFSNGAIGTDGAHFGCRLVFGRDGKIYVTLGDRHQRNLAQDLNELHGKVLRFNEDGSIPSDNPFVGRSGVRTEIYSFGHRNPQGLDRHPGTGELFVSEHGPTGEGGIPGGGDEINLLRSGGNYGWPLVHHEKEDPRFISPLREYTPAVAPSGAAFYVGSAIKEWNGDFFVATLRGRSLLRLRVLGGRVTEEEVLLNGRFGRLRDVATGNDGNLLVISQNGDLIRISRSDSSFKD